MRSRKWIGHIAVVRVPMPAGLTTSQYITAYAPRAQAAGNLQVLDEQWEIEDGVSYLKFAVTHVNPRGTDLSDLADFAEQAALRCGFELEPNYQPVLYSKPIGFSSRPHTGSPRRRASRRRGRPVGAAEIRVG